MKRKNKKQELEELREERILYIGILVVTFILITLAIVRIIDENNTKSIEEGKQLGMNIAEVNCLKLVCNQTGCEQLEKIDYIQKYCKSLVYGTDFYLRYGK